MLASILLSPRPCTVIIISTYKNGLCLAVSINYSNYSRYICLEILPQDKKSCFVHLHLWVSLYVYLYMYLYIWPRQNKGIPVTLCWWQLHHLSDVIHNCHLMKRLADISSLQGARGNSHLCHCHWPYWLTLTWYSLLSPRGTFYHFACSRISWLVTLDHASVQPSVWL